MLFKLINTLGLFAAGWLVSRQYHHYVTDTTEFGTAEAVWFTILTISIAFDIRNIYKALK